MQGELVSPVITPRCHQISQHSEAPMAKPCWLSLPLPLPPPCPHLLSGPCPFSLQLADPLGSGISCLPKSSSVQVRYFHGHKGEL